MCQFLGAESVASDATCREDLIFVLEVGKRLDSDPDNRVAESIVLVPELPGDEQHRINDEVAQSVH